MNIVVSGYYGHGNTGDEAILAGMLAAMRTAEPGVEVTVLSGHPEATRGMHGVDAVPYRSPIAVWRALRRSAGLVSGGGGLLQDRTSARPVAYYTGVMGLARMAARPYVVHAQGLGPIVRRPNRALAAMALRGAAAVSLRDDESVALARALGVRRPIAVVPDPALALRPPLGTAGHLLLAVRGWPGGEGHLDAIGAAAATLSSDLPVVALPMHEPVDRDASVRVCAGIHGARIVPPGATFAERLELIGSAAVVIAMRLHGLVLAAAAGVPGVAVSYDPKVDAFASRLGMPLAGHLGAPIDAARIVEAARDELDADLTARDRIVADMRGELETAATTSLAAIDGAMTPPS